MFSRFIIITLLLFTCHSVFAGTLEDYAPKRDEILLQPSENRLEALADHPFDTTTALGKYFYLSSFLYIENDPEFYALTDSELETLRADYPQYFYEREVLMVWLSDLPDEERFEQFRAIQSIARKNNWPRIEGWATSLLASSLQSAELHFNAILEINKYTPFAPHTDNAGVTYSYPLIAIFYDLTTSLYKLNDYEGTVKYCRRLRNYLPNDIYAQFDGLACEAKALLALNRTEEFQDKLKELNRLADKTELVESKIQVLIMSAAFYRDQKRYDMMNMYAKDALDLHKKATGSMSPYAFPIYHLLTFSQVSLENTEQAEFYLNKLGEVSDPINTNGPMANVYESIAQARIYKLKEQYKEAIPLYEKAVDALYLNEEPSFSFSQLKNIEKSLDVRELYLTKKQLQEERQYSTIVTLITGVSFVIAVVTSALLWRQSRRKRDLEHLARFDSLTQVYNRWFATNLIKARLNSMKKRDDKVCLVLLDVDHFKRINHLFGHKVGDAVLSHFARLCKYQVRDEDVFGRYGGETFVLMLSGATQSDAAEKLQGLRDILSHQDLTKLGADGALAFSSGVVEVSEKADITQVLSQCDKLLYAAKHNGRNQDICAPFRPSVQDDIL